MNNRVWISDGTSYRKMEFREFENILDQAYDSKSIRPNLFVKTGGEYFIDPTQSLGLSVTLSDGRSSRDNDNYTIDQGLETQDTLESVIRTVIAAATI